MNKWIIGAAIIFAACQTQNAENTENKDSKEGDMSKAETAQFFGYYGDTIDAGGAMSGNELMTQMNATDSMNAKVEAKIIETCEMKGCWMTLDMGDGEKMRVSFKDYGFFVPKDGVEGKTAVIEGKAYVDTLSVDYLRHLAKDAGKSEEEIASIKEPEVSVNFEANGVVIR